MTDPAPISDEKLDEIISGAVGVTHGPWHPYAKGSQRIEDADKFYVAETGPYDATGRTAAHIARLDPATVLSMAARIRAQDAELARLRTDRAGVVEECARVAESEPTLYFDDELGRINAETRKAHATAIAAAIRALAPAPNVEGETP